MAKYTLEQSISALAGDFAREVAKAIRDASLGELTGFVANGARAGRPGKKVRTPRLGWPKCPACGKNAWPRGKGYCFEHAKAGGARSSKTASKKRLGRPAKAKPASAE
ncbi:MAG: hypothetical protein HYY06_15300 [Deltaproteobacteria bacterium]|nr:hypothetical protein [Deltaproteobacteria bacterium]